MDLSRQRGFLLPVSWKYVCYHMKDTLLARSHSSEVKTWQHMDTRLSEHGCMGIMPIAVLISFWFMGTTSLVRCTVFPEMHCSLHRHVQEICKGTPKSWYCSDPGAEQSWASPAGLGHCWRHNPALVCPRNTNLHGDLHCLLQVTSGCHRGSLRRIISKWCHDIKCFGKAWLCFCIFSVVTTVGSVGESVGSVILLHIGLVLSPHSAIEFNIYS